jgi:hypothetical protein
MRTPTFEIAYPNLWKLLDGSAFQAEASGAEKMEISDFKACLQKFEFTDLMNLLCGALVPDWQNVNGAELEANIATIVGALGLEKTRTTFRDKLLVRDKDTLQDTCYEIAATAKACVVLDKGSVEMEKPLPGKAKNSDIYGTFGGAPVRIEVTVIHEDRPAPIDLDMEEIVKAAKVDFGFQIEMRSALTDEGEAARLRALIESLCEKHIGSGGADIEIDHVCLKWENGRYIRIKGPTPIGSIRLFSEGDRRGSQQTREMNHGASARIVSPHYLKEDFKNPAGVFDVTDLPDFEGQHPVSKKIREMIGGKLRQCEPGLINIVAFGNPEEMNDSEVANALHGAPFVIVTAEVDENGYRRGGEGRFARAPKAPFNPPENLSVDEQQEFIEPFKDLSAVWHLRIGNSRKSEVIVNPNAKIAIPAKLVEALSVIEQP